MNIDIRNIDFENPSRELIFDLCMGDVRILYGKYDEPNLEIDRVDHRDLLVKYDLQSFSDLLVEYMGKWFQRQDSMLKAKREISDRYYHDKVLYELKVAKILKMFISGQRNEMDNLEVSVTDEFGKINIVEPVLINHVKEVIIKEFKKLKLSETELSREEAIEEILECEDQDWINEYTDGVFYDGFHVYIDKVPEELLEGYMFTHYKPREITLDLVDKTIEELETVINDSKEKPGAFRRRS